MTEPDSPQPRRSWPGENEAEGPDSVDSPPQRGLGWPVLPTSADGPQSQPTPERPDAAAARLAQPDVPAAEWTHGPAPTGPEAPAPHPGGFDFVPGNQRPAGPVPGFGPQAPQGPAPQQPGPGPQQAGPQFGPQGQPFPPQFGPQGQPRTGPQQTVPQPAVPQQKGPHQAVPNQPGPQGPDDPSSPFQASARRAAPPAPPKPVKFGDRVKGWFGGSVADQASREAAEDARRAEEETERAREEARRAEEAEQVRLAEEAEAERQAEADRLVAEELARREELHRVIDTPVRHHLVTVSSLKGGVTKTTVVLALGTALALHRRDLVLAIDGNAHRGTLAGRLGEETQLTVRDLVAEADDVTTATDFRRFTSQADSRFEVLASESNPLHAQGFSAEEYRTALKIAKTFRSVILTDTGTDLTLPLMTEVYQNTDTLVVPATTAYDGAELAWETLDWWEDHADPELVRQAVVPVTQIEPLSVPADVDLHPDQLIELREEFLAEQERRRNEILDRFAPRVGTVIFIPYDRSLHQGGRFDWDRLQSDSQDAYESVAYAVASRFVAPD